MTSTSHVVSLGGGIKRRPKNVALVGCPNVGKSSLFNVLTGLRQKVANYPGITVERRIGTMSVPAGSLTVVDLPGTCSLVPRSPDEEVVREALLDRLDHTPAPDVVVFVADAAQIERSLFLLSQVLELGFPVVVALNQVDLALGAGIQVDPAALAERLGVPVVPVSGRTGAGKDELAAEIVRGGSAPQAPLLEFPPALHAEAEHLAEMFLPLFGDRARSLAALQRALGSPGAAIELQRRLDEADATSFPGWEQALVDSRAALAEGGHDVETATAHARYAWVDSIASSVVHRVADANPWQHRLDQFLTHRIFGLAVLAIVFATLFLVVFWVADPVIGWVEDLMGWTGAIAAAPFGDGLLADFVEKGLVAGMGAFLVFVPPIALLFICIEALDASGYLARAAFLLDRVMGAVGLPGRAFLPLLSGFACAIPGIMATRAIADRRDRFITLTILPLMSCSARLPVYAVVVSAVFASSAAWVPALVVISMYLLGVVLALIGAKLLRTTVLPGPRSPLLLELPPYRWPTARTVLGNTFRRTWGFIRGAGPIILGFSMLLWAGMTFPRDVPFSQDFDAQIATLTEQIDAAGEDAAAELGDQRSDLRGAREAERLAHTYMGSMGKFIEPVFEPLGFDWKMDVAIIGSFAAREVFVPTLGVIYAKGEVDEEDEGLLASMRSDRHADGRLVYTPLTGISLLVFYVIALQCMSTLAVIHKETGSWKWAAGVFFVLTAVAYLASLTVFQVGTLLGFA